MFLSALVVIVVVAILVILILSMKDKKKSGRIHFYATGKDSGFSFKEIELLYKLALKSKLENPASLFASQNQLDTCIRSLVKTMRISGFGDDKGNQDFLSKLYDYRKKIEMEKPKVKNGISNSRQISEGQNLRILVEGTGVFKSQVVKTTNQYLTISRPTSGKLPGTFSWQGHKLSVYFWREEDAGYVFDTDVLDEVFSKGIASLKIGHSDSLFRTQKRKSIRLKIHKAAFLYPVTSDEDLNRIETSPGVKCFLKDLSDTGCALSVGGKAVAGLRIKVQFALNNVPICMSGTVRSLEYKEDLNVSILHVEADPLPIEIRNMILGEVFGMLPEEEEDLPFRLLGEEAENISSEASSERKTSDFFDEDLDSMGTAM
jgi:c-di-GMP-binding flagellar brake protein YcgR